MKYLKLTQQDATDLLGLITSDGLAIKASAAARVHQLQALLSSEPTECEECIALRQALKDHANLADGSPV